MTGRNVIVTLGDAGLCWCGRQPSYTVLLSRNCGGWRQQQSGVSFPWLSFCCSRGLLPLSSSSFARTLNRVILFWGDSSHTLVIGQQSLQLSKILIAQSDSILDSFWVCVGASSQQLHPADEGKLVNPLFRLHTALKSGAGPVVPTSLHAGYGGRDKASAVWTD